MPNYIATEFDPRTLELTGRKEVYTASCPEDAVADCLYTKSLADGRARIGATGRVVYASVPGVGNRGYSITPESLYRDGGRK